MSTRYLVEKANGSFEDVGADLIHFSATHVVFSNGDNQLVVAYRANDVVAVTKEDE